MTSYERQLVQLIRAAVNGGQRPDDIECQQVWELAQRHHLEALVYEQIKDIPTLSPELASRAAETYDKMLGREVYQDLCLRQVESALQDAGIRYAVLKGGVLKKDYPGARTRFMSDLDFYIRQEDRDRIREVLEGIGGVFKGTESGDQQFRFWDQVGVEFHGRLLYRRTDNGIAGYPDWSYMDGDSCRLTEEGYFLNLIGHAVYNLSEAGLGIRYVLDLWIYRHRHRPQPDWEAVDARLSEDGIFTVAHNLMDLAEFLFGDREGDPLMEEMAEFVVRCGLNGSYRQRCISQAARSGKKGAVLSQVVRNRAEYENRYPWLKKYPFLLPVAWARRGFHSLKTHKKAIRRWTENVRDITDADIEKQRETLSRFGL